MPFEIDKLEFLEQQITKILQEIDSDFVFIKEISYNMLQQSKKLVQNAQYFYQILQVS
jgi:hypothetical protein